MFKFSLQLNIISHNNSCSFFNFILQHILTFHNNKMNSVFNMSIPFHILSTARSTERRSIQVQSVCDNWLLIKFFSIRLLIMYIFTVNSYNFWTSSELHFWIITRRGTQSNRNQSIPINTNQHIESFPMTFSTSSCLTLEHQFGHSPLLLIQALHIAQDPSLSSIFLPAYLITFLVGKCQTS